MNKVGQQHLERDALSLLFKKEIASVPQDSIKEDSNALKFVSMTEFFT